MYPDSAACSTNRFSCVCSNDYVCGTLIDGVGSNGFKTLYYPQGECSAYRTRCIKKPSGWVDLSDGAGAGAGDDDLLDSAMSTLGMGLTAWIGIAAGGVCLVFVLPIIICCCCCGAAGAAAKKKGDANALPIVNAAMPYGTAEAAETTFAGFGDDEKKSGDSDSTAIIAQLQADMAALTEEVAILKKAAAATEEKVVVADLDA